ncbi:16S rRNA (guanine(966)-N(2))-methyltransferase [Candidatus Doolittlea endobia]|uniref:Ribosomal RNA small subunit methyltransferase D n=1 Tax=Candidatus Doolittlea endobia TaxID=1778262 RepID=A0A143WST5_9ENTR|nr:16S rRNA (guanine(966)-N(2))-methyltransferase [Candidatus Doolittlea endobia]CUX96760.1 Ribosomal RNA small subunit methyltransferase D [Candidatus Doolittlea endobia]
MIHNNIARLAGHIRIIGGRWRGRKLPVLDNPSLRPTTDRVRETLFNWLAPVIQGARCLDCFSGSGALGLEALSRAAASVTLLEQNRAVSTQLSRNLLVLQAQQAEVITTDSLLWLTKSNAVFDIVFIDPPFRHGMIISTVIALEQYRHLADGAWIYIETEIENSATRVPAYWKLHREKIAGQVAYQLYIRQITPDKKDNIRCYLT